MSFSLLNAKQEGTPLHLVPFRPQHTTQIYICVCVFSNLQSVEPCLQIVVILLHGTSANPGQHSVVKTAFAHPILGLWTSFNLSSRRSRAIEGHLVSIGSCNWLCIAHERPTSYEF